MRELRAAVGPALLAGVFTLVLGAALARRPASLMEFGLEFAPCTAGRLPGTPATGALIALVLAIAVGGLASDVRRARVAAVAAGLCGALVFAAVEGFASLAALALQLGALLAFRQERRRWSWGLAVVATWVWPVAALVLVALLIGEIDRLRSRGGSWSQTLPGPLMAFCWASAAALPAVFLRLDRLLSGVESRGSTGVAEVAGAWSQALVVELGGGAAWAGTPLAFVRYLWLAAAGFLGGWGMIVVVRRAGREAAFTAQRLAVGLAAWTLLVTAGLGLGRGSWGSTQALVHVVVLLLLVEGGADLARRERLRPWVAAAAVIVALGWSMGLWTVARHWTALSAHV